MRDTMRNRQRKELELSLGIILVIIHILRVFHGMIITRYRAFSGDWAAEVYIEYCSKYYSLDAKKAPFIFSIQYHFFLLF